MRLKPGEQGGNWQEVPCGYPGGYSGERRGWTLSVPTSFMPFNLGTGGKHMVFVQGLELTNGST